jgi:hypothetical protein
MIVFVLEPESEAASRLGSAEQYDANEPYQHGQYRKSEYGLKESIVCLNAIIRPGLMRMIAD